MSIDVTDNSQRQSGSLGLDYGEMKHEGVKSSRVRRRVRTKRSGLRA